MTKIARAGVPPTICVVWLDGRWYRGKDTEDFVGATKADKLRLEFLAERNDFGPIYSIRRAYRERTFGMKIPVPTQIRFTVNDVVLVDGPAVAHRFRGRKRPDVEHYRIERKVNE